MPARLLTGRWSGTFGSETKQPDSAFNNPENVGIRWSLENFGTQRIEVLVKPRNRYDAYDRYNNHLGQRIAVYSHWAYRPITGFVTSVEYAGGGRIQYVAKGPIVRMMSEPDTSIYSNTMVIGGSSGAIATILSRMPTRIDDTTTTNIATNTGTTGGTQPKFPEGAYPAEFLNQMLEKSDSSNNIYDFWLVDNVFTGTSIGKWTPYYQPRSSSAAINWQVNRSDIKDLSLSRNIDDTVTDANVFYGRVSGTHTGANNAAVLTDGTKDFLNFGVAPGDSVTNITDGSRGQIEEGITTTTVPGDLSGGTDNDWDTNDVYNITIKNQKNKQTATATAEYWKNVINIFEPHFGSGQATQYANSLLHPEAAQVQAFTITAPTIRDGSGGRWPLWEVIAQGGGYIRVNDLFPAAAIFGQSMNNLTVFRITALDYDYASNTLRVNVDNKDKRLDVRLRREGILNSEMVNVGAK